MAVVAVVAVVACCGDCRASVDVTLAYGWRQVCCGNLVIVMVLQLRYLWLDRCGGGDEGILLAEVASLPVLLCVCLRVCCPSGCVCIHRVFM